MSPTRFVVLCCLLSGMLTAHAAPLATLAEQSGFQRTARYEEVLRLCAAFQQQWPEQVRCTSFGRTPEGRSMMLLAASSDGVLDAASARRARRPVVFMQGGIHAGEIDGKDAGLLALREMLEGKTAPNLLKRATFVFVPVLNVDGHERFGRWNRPNQVGPEEMGWRTTAQNLNLNRDYVKADAPEMQALLRVLNEWDPVLYVDLHVTDGAQFQHDVSYVVAPTLAGDGPLRQAGVALRDELMAHMAKRGALPLDFYPSFLVEDDPSSGFAVQVAPKRFSEQYWAARNRFGVLVETHSWKDYPTRVRRTHDTILALLEIAGREGPRWLKLTQEADARAAQLGGQDAVLVYDNTDHVKPIDFRGYAYTREHSDISGALMTRYDASKPQIWRVPLKDEVRPSISVIAPRGGYIIPAAYAAQIAPKLLLHQIEFRTLNTARASTPLQTFRATSVTPAAGTFEGHTTMTLAGEWRAEARDVPAGSLFAPIAQPRVRLLMTLLEPKDPDSLASWGFFAVAFERKEYMEAYVAEDVARQLLKDDPALRTEFETKLKNDPAFANSAAERLDFFYRRHPSWDEQLNLYPVYRTESTDW